MSLPRSAGYSPFALIALACAVLMGYALFAQHVQGFEPCMLCMVQRVFVCATGLVALIAVLHRPGAVGRRIYGILGASMAVVGAYVAGRHVYLQQLALTAPEQLDGCAPSFEYALQNYGLPKFLGAIFIRDQDCGVIDWTFMGLSMPAWVLIWFVAIAIALVWAGFRRTR